jgi:hypothetical protein
MALGVAAAAVDHWTEEEAEVAGLVRRRLTQVDIWDGMIEEPVPADLGELHLPGVTWAVGALILDKLHERFDEAAAKHELSKDVP